MDLAEAENLVGEPQVKADLMEAMVAQDTPEMVNMDLVVLDKALLQENLANLPVLSMPVAVAEALIIKLVMVLLAQVAMAEELQVEKMRLPILVAVAAEVLVIPALAAPVALVSL